MKAIVLGCGTSTGVPLPGCHCEVCHSPDPKNNRLRSSMILQSDEISILIDTAPDLRQQVLRANITSIDAILYTHAHADHILGLEDIRPFNFLNKKRIPLYATNKTAAELQRFFHYVFNPNEHYEGGLLPQVTLCEISEHPFNVLGVPIIPIPLKHGAMDVMGFRVGDFAYCTDCSHIPETSLPLLSGLTTLFLDGLRWAKDGRHATHFSIEAAIETAKIISATTTYLTHTTHSIEYERDSKLLPAGIQFSFDGLTVPVKVSPTR